MKNFIFLSLLAWGIICMPISELKAQYTIPSCASCPTCDQEDARLVELTIVKNALMAGNVFRACKSATNHNVINFHTNSNFNIDSDESIWLNFGDGSPEIQIDPGSSFSHTYPLPTGSNTTYSLSVTLRKTDFPNIIFTDTPNLILKADYSTNAVGFTPPDEVWNISGSHAYIQFSPSHPNILRKPVIFVDGLDFDTKTYTVNGEIVRHGSTGWDVFITGNDGSKPNPDDNEPSAFRNYPTAFKTLNDNDYDIIFLDFKDGADYIQNNGEVLIELITRVNQRKVEDAMSSGIPPCDNAIVGASMGGQIAKWALSTMEERSLDHQSHTYVSFDSPQKGAHIPLSLQAFVFHMKDINPDIWEQLNRPAPQQLLLPEGDYSIQIFNAFGEMVLEKTNLSAYDALSIGQWQSGTYYLKAQDATGRQRPISRSFMVQNL